MLPRHTRFVQAYAEGYSAIESAMLAGYSAASAKANAHRILSHPDVAAAVDVSLQGKMDKFQELNQCMDALFEMSLDQKLPPDKRLKAASLALRAFHMRYQSRRPRLSDTAIPRPPQQPQPAMSPAPHTTLPELDDFHFTPEEEAALRALDEQCDREAAEAEAELAAQPEATIPLQLPAPSTKPTFSQNLRKTLNQATHRQTQTKKSGKHHQKPSFQSI